MSRVFNGSSDYISANGASTPVDIPTGPMSISFWFFPTSLTGERDVVSKWGGTNPTSQYLIGTGISAFGAAGNQISYCVGHFAAITGVFGFVTTALSINNWYQVVLTVDPAGTYQSGSPTVLMRLAGAATGLSFTAFRENRAATSTNLNIGGQNNIADFAGRITQLGIWNACLSPGEIIALQNGTSPSRIRALSLKGYWPLYGQSSPEPDLSGSGLDGTLHGTTATNQFIGTGY